MSGSSMVQILLAIIAAFYIIAFVVSFVSLTRTSTSATDERLARLERQQRVILDRLGVAETETDMAEVVEYLMRGQKIHAIKAYRDATGAGLKEAKDAVEEIARKQRQAVLDRLGVAETETDMAEVVEYLMRGQKIHAIKAYRDATGAGLKEAKDAVEEIARQRGL